MEKITKVGVVIKKDLISYATASFKDMQGFICMITILMYGILGPP